MLFLQPRFVWGCASAALNICDKAHACCSVLLRVLRVAVFGFSKLEWGYHVYMPKEKKWVITRILNYSSSLFISTVSYIYIIIIHITPPSLCLLPFQAKEHPVVQDQRHSTWEGGDFWPHLPDFPPQPIAQRDVLVPDPEQLRTRCWSLHPVSVRWVTLAKRYLFFIKFIKRKMLLWKKEKCLFFFPQRSSVRVVFVPSLSPTQSSPVLNDIMLNGLILLVGNVIALFSFFFT